MDVEIALEDVRASWLSRDPTFPELFVGLANQAIRSKPVRTGAITWRTVQARAGGPSMKGLSRDQRRERRLADLARVEGADAEVELPDRLKLHAILDELIEDDGAFARYALLRIIAEVPLVWGPWRALKRLFKLSESRGDWEIYGALLARFDREFAQLGRSGREVRRPTLRYLVRRGWRRLRRLGVQLPAAYPDAASAVLANYPEHTWFMGTWVANHVFNHETGRYSRGKFNARYSRSGPKLEDRAFADAWRRSPRPLFSLLERAKSEYVRGYAAKALKTDFRTQLREVEPAWVVRLINVRSPSIDEFAVWLFGAVPKFDPGSFRDLGLHDAALVLLDSDSPAAALWAAGYARTHARDLPLSALIDLANADHTEVRRLARDLLRDRDPRKDVGLAAWGRLLGTEYAHKLAATAIREHFGARELTTDWFTERFLSGDPAVVAFARELLPTVHPARKLPADFWSALLDHPKVDAYAAAAALDALEEADPSALDGDVLWRALLNPHTESRIRGWFDADRIPPAAVAGLLKALAYEPTWNADPWIAELQASDRPWARDLEFRAGRSEWALKRLGDPRTFSAEDLGFEWLFDMVQRSEPRYHDFAVATLSRSFKPEDFIDPEQRSSAPVEDTAVDESVPVEADLQGKGFLFTGKLATMTRAEATKKVTGANGKNVSGVSANLDFLVIGDEGSPLYGGGRKGSKQVKAEKLIEGGADLKIISETAFLQMLAGESVEVDEDAALAGAERLWDLLTSPGPADAPLRSFALHYLRHHHADIHMHLTDRPLDPGFELPDAFLVFDRAKQLCADDRPELRELGLLWLEWELASWAPDMAEIVALCELPHAEVRDFVERALTVPEAREHRRYRIDPSVLTPEAAYRFCESSDRATRALGMRLIALNPRLAIPSELFRLTESPDRQVRGFVIRQLWGLYRDKATTPAWSPPEREGEDPVRPKPDEWPAEAEDVRVFLRRSLFGIPPARLPKGSSGTLKPLPARKAKLALIEVCRDLALEDRAFAERITPLYQEFAHSRGQSESAACVVALVQLGERWGAGIGGLP